MLENLMNAIREVVDCLVDGKFQELERRTGGERLSAAEMADAIQTYGRTLVYPPVAVLERADVKKIEAASVPSWSIVVPLWTREEGRSDLSLELTLRQCHDELKIEIDDIHVL